MQEENEPAFVRQTQGKRDGRGRFLKGASGNPSGMRPGTKRHRTRALEELLSEYGGALLERAIEVALGDRGGPTLRALLPLLVAPLMPRGPQIFVDMPAINSAEGATKAIETVAAAVAAGEVDVVAGERLIGMLSAAVKAREVADLEARIAALENAQATGQSH